MKNEEHHVILAIHPCVRGFGYCLFESPNKPLDYGVKVVRKSDSEKALRWSAQLIDFFEPQIVVLREIRSHHKTSERIAQLICEMKKTAQARDLAVHQYDRMQIKNVFEQFGATTKYSIAKRLQEWIPDLHHKSIHKRKPWQTEPYNGPLYDAVALGLTHCYLL